MAIDPHDKVFVRQVIAPVFDVGFYRRSYPDVVANDSAALDHYIDLGWREGRWPTPQFDSAFYLRANPDVVAAGFNPLQHFLLWGAREGRPFRGRSANPARSIIAAATPLRDQARQFSPLNDILPCSCTDLADAVRESGAAAVRMVVSLSHDRYLNTGGGVQNCVADEQRAFVEQGWAYLHLCPARPLPMLADPVPAEAFEVVVTLNGKQLGLSTMADVIAVVATEAEAKRELYCAVHQLLGHVPELVQQLIHACKSTVPLVWIHDLFTLCPSINMLRNEATFCGGPGIGSLACRICNSGNERDTHIHRIAALFAAIRPTVLVPSATILSFWQARANMEYRDAVVVPPCHVELDPFEPPASCDSTLRIGFLGAPDYRKGWHIFSALAERHNGDPRYTFFQFGWADPAVTNVAHVRVNVTPSDRHAMVNAIAAERIDIAINWSLCYESFSFTAIEAVAGGAFVLTRRNAGNVWPLVSAVGAHRGHAVDSEFELQALFADGSILGLAASADRRRGRLVIGRGTAQVLVGDDNFG